VDAYFPFTEPSYELEIYFNGVCVCVCVCVCSMRVRESVCMLYVCVRVRESVCMLYVCACVCACVRVPGLELEVLGCMVQPA